MNRQNTVHFVLLLLLVYVTALMLLSYLALPRLDSTGGRLVHVPLGDRSLAQNQVRLDLPPDSAWETVSLRFRLESDEAVYFLFDGADTRTLALRLSRHADFDSAILTFQGDGTGSPWELLASAPVDCPPSLFASPREVRFQRTEGAVTAEIGTGAESACQLRLPNGGPGRAFEVALLPPDDMGIHDAVTLTEARLEGGRTLAARPWAPSLSSPVLLFALSLVASYALFSLLARLGALLVPYWWTRRSWDVAVLALYLLGLLGLLSWLTTTSHFPIVGLKLQSFYRVVVVLLVLWTCLGFVLRDRLLLSFPRLRTGLFGRTVLLPIRGLLFLLPFLLLVGAVGGPRRSFGDLSSYTRASAELRIVCLGGSTTTAYPRPDADKSWPSFLERRLRAHAPGGARVLNLAVGGYDIDDVVAVLRDEEALLRAFQPTHVVIDSVVNNRGPDIQVRMPRGMREAIALVHAASKDAGILLVKQPGSLFFRHDDTGQGAFEIIDEVARQTGADVVDPRAAFRAHRDESLFLDPVHMSTQGHALLAEAVAARIVAPQRPSPPSVNGEGPGTNPTRVGEPTPPGLGRRVGFGDVFVFLATPAVRHCTTACALDGTVPGPIRRLTFSDGVQTRIYGVFSVSMAFWGCSGAVRRGGLSSGHRGCVGDQRPESARAGPG